MTEIIHCVKGSKNLGLAKKLGVNLNNDGITSFEHPDDPRREIFWIYDIIHILKNIRNHLMDTDIVLPDGTMIKKKQHFVDLLEKIRCGDNDHTSGFHLSEDDLEVQSTDRQDMAKCLHVLSERYGNICLWSFKL